MDETTPLKWKDPDSGTDPETGKCLEERSKLDRLFLIVALIGVFLAYTDETFVLSIHGEIASEFNSLPLGPWLITGYTLGFVITLPLYGRVCELYGYKVPLMIAYTMFAGGCVLTGFSDSIWVSIAGRFISGVGASGMTDLISIILNDLVSLKEFAVLRSYIGMVGTFAATVGAPLGGFLADSIGWRCAFFIQGPIAMFCLVCTAWKLSIPQRAIEASSKTQLNLSGIVFLGIALASTVGLFQFAANFSSHGSFMAKVCLAGIVIGALLFGLNERYWTANPLVPLPLLQGHGVCASYISQTLIFITAYGMSSHLAEFWIRTWNVSNKFAAATMIPLAVGFPLGSSIAAKVIKRTGTYKIASIAGCTIMAMSTTLMAIRWPQGPHLGDLIYEFTHGIGSGILLIATFVGLSATVPSSNTTVAFTIYHLCQQLGILMGTSATSASTQAVFRQLLARQLGNGKDALEIIRGVLSDSRFAFELSDAVQSIVQGAFLQSFRTVPVFCTISICLVIPILLCYPELPIE